MEFASRKGIRAFLAALLVVSLLGTSGIQMLSQAFASEDAATEQQAASNADQAAENESTPPPRSER